LDTYRTTGLNAQVITLKNYDAILGKPWLHHANPYINWRSNELIFKYGPRTINIQANTTKPGCHTTTTLPPPKERTSKGKERQKETSTSTPEISKLETPPLKQMAKRSKPFPSSVQQPIHHQEPKDQSSTNLNHKDTPGIDFAHLMEYWPPPPQIETVLDKRIKKNKPEYLIKCITAPRIIKGTITPLLYYGYYCFISHTPYNLSTIFGKQGMPSLFFSIFISFILFHL
jgi:hypothetical protein